MYIIEVARNILEALSLLEIVICHSGLLKLLLWVIGSILARRDGLQAPARDGSSGHYLLLFLSNIKSEKKRKIFLYSSWYRLHCNLTHNKQAEFICKFACKLLSFNNF